MSRKAKVNPRRRPASRAEVEKARKNAVSFGIDATAAVVLLVLHEEFGFGATRLHRCWAKVEDLCMDVSRGTVKVNEIMDVLRDEYKIVFMEDKK